MACAGKANPRCHLRHAFRLLAVQTYNLTTPCLKYPLVLSPGICREADNGILLGAAPCSAILPEAAASAGIDAVEAPAVAVAAVVAAAKQVQDDAPAASAAVTDATIQQQHEQQKTNHVKYSDLGDVNAYDARLLSRILHVSGGSSAGATGALAGTQNVACVFPLAFVPLRIVLASIGFADGDDGLEIGALPASLSGIAPGSPHSYTRMSSRSQLKRRVGGTATASPSLGGSPLSTVTPAPAGSARLGGGGWPNSPAATAAAVGLSASGSPASRTPSSITDMPASVNPRSPLASPGRDRKGDAAAAGAADFKGHPTPLSLPLPTAAAAPAAAALTRPAFDDDSSNAGGWALHPFRQVDSFRLDDSAVARSQAGPDDVSQHPSESSDGITGGAARRRAGRRRGRRALRAAGDAATATTGGHTAPTTSTGTGEGSGDAYEDEDDDVDAVDDDDDDEDYEEEEEEDDEVQTFVQAGTSAFIEVPRNMLFGPVDCGVTKSSGTGSSEIDFAALRGSGPLSFIEVEALAEQVCIVVLFRCVYTTMPLARFLRTPP